MADTDPIELKIILNTPEVLAEYQKIVDKSAEVDKSVPKIEIDNTKIVDTAANLAAVDVQNKAIAASIAAAKAKFSEFVQAMTANNNALDEKAQLTDKATAALQRHEQTIEFLKAKAAESFDVTQIAVYQYQIEQADKAIKSIIESANKNVNLMDPAEIEAANQKIKEAQALLDKISDSTFTPSFASPEELEVLSAEINKTDDAFQQLGTVIDFVSAKMAGMDQGTEEFKQLEADIRTANDMLGRTPQLYDATGNSINQMNDALKTFQEQLAGETDPEAIKILNTNIETLENGIQQVKNAGKTGFDEFGNKIEEQKEKTVSLQTELENLVGQMAKLRMANQENSVEYGELKQKATEVRTAIVETNKEINSETKTSSSFDKLIQLTSGITAGFTLAQGASALFGAEQEQAEKVIQKVTGAMAVLQSLQEIQVQIKNRDTVATGQQTAAQAAYSLVVGTSTGALKLFRIALAATGIGLIILLLAGLIANWDKVTAAVKRSFPALDNFGDKMDTMKSYIMGFLRAYLSLYETVFKTIKKLISLDLKGALTEVKNTGANAAKAFGEGKAESDANTKEEKNRKILEASVNEMKDRLAVQKAAGKNTEELERKIKKATTLIFKEGSKERKEAMQDLAVFEAEKQKERNDAAKKSSEKRLKDESAAAKKANALAEKFAQERQKIIDKINENSTNVNNKETEGDEIAAIKKKYETLLTEAKKYKVDEAKIMQLKLDEVKETDMKKYELETKAKLQELNRQKELYAAYESFKTNIAQTEFAKRNNINLEEFGSFSAILDAEIKKLTDKGTLNAQEAEHLKKLQDMKTDAETDKGNKGSQDLDKAIQDTITYQEKRDAIEKEFADRRKLIEDNTNGTIREEKLAILEQQKQDALNAANQEAIEKTEIFRQLNDRMLQETQQELKARIAALKKMLQDASLSPEVKAKVGFALKEAESLKGVSALQTKINQMLRQRILLEALAAGTVDKTSSAYLDLQRQIALLDGEMEDLAKNSKFDEAKKWADFAQQSFGELAGIVGETNEGLADTFQTMSDLAGVASSLADVGKQIQKGLLDGFTSGNIMGIVTGVIGAIGGLLKLGKAARESEKKAQEEIKKRQEEQLQAQLDYNATLRQRMIDETKINDLYKSRVDNIKEEMAARTKAMQKNLKDQQMLFNRLLNMTTTVGQYTEKYGGFLGMGRKTRVVDIQKTVGSMLGVGGASAFVSIFDKSPFLKRLLQGNSPFNNMIPADTVTITDEMFDKLELLNSQQPLTGDAKNAYEQLKKLRDEYGSFEEANRQLEIQLKNAITGTTAQSLADSIREGLKSGKKSFADFANDIEGFLREAIMAGISAKMIEPKIQELQDALADMMGDGILSAEERAQFQEMYMAIVNSSQEYMDIVNQAGVGLTTGSSSPNSLQGAIKGASQESIDILSGHTAAMKLTQFETNTILKNGFAQQLEQSSNMIRLQIEIEKNTKRTADNTEKLYDVNDNVVKVADGQDKYYKALQAAGIIK